MADQGREFFRFLVKFFSVKSILLIWTYVIVPQYARAMNRVISMRKCSNTF